MAILFDPKEIARAISAEIGREVIDVYTRFIQTVVPATPKKTGLAQGNWRTSIVNIPDGVIARTSGARAISSGIQSVRAGRNRLSRGRGGTIWVVNNVPYIGLLNSGSSAQAPAFFVETALAAAQNPGTPRRKLI